jgi:hypothetical protein
VKTRARFAALLMTTTAGIAAPMTVGTATPALADNCEPTEPVVRVVFPNYEENILDERDNPTCYVLNGYVYPRLCDDSTTLFGTCLQTINPDPFEPVSVQPYSPSPGRIVCSVSSFALGTIGLSSSCSSSDIDLRLDELPAGTEFIFVPAS